MTKTDLLRHYKTLGISTTKAIDWPHIKKRYRALARRWHPDRFPAGHSERAVPEEKFKEINAAYSALSAYHRAHGKLPNWQETSGPASSGAKSSRAERRTKKPSTVRSGTGRRRSDHSVAAPNKSRGSRIVIVVVMFLVAYAVLIAMKHYTEMSVQPVVEEPIPFSEQPAQPALPPPFTFGATYGEVLAAQGTPTATDDNVWHYGLSRVHFVNGRVAFWETHPDHPLNIRISNPELSGKTIP